MHPRGQKSIFGEKLKVQFFDQKCPKCTLRVPNSIFGQKIKSSLFRPKMTKNALRRSEIDFWSKIKMFSFSTKKVQKCSLEVIKRFFVKRLKVHFLDQKLPKIDSRGHISICGSKIES